MALTFAAHKKPRTMDRVSQRRQKIVSGIDQQFTLLDQHRNGQPVKNAWFWQGADGKYFSSIRYGRSEIELAKGMFSVAAPDVDGLIEALKEIRSMVLNGKLDENLNKASDTMRSKFKTE
jgi:hypothetical protein